MQQTFFSFHQASIDNTAGPGLCIWRGTNRLATGTGTNSQPPRHKPDDHRGDHNLSPWASEKRAPPGCPGHAARESEKEEEQAGRPLAAAATVQITGWSGSARARSQHGTNQMSIEVITVFLPGGQKAGHQPVDQDIAGRSQRKKRDK